MTQDGISRLKGSSVWSKEWNPDKVVIVIFEINLLTKSFGKISFQWERGKNSLLKVVNHDITHCCVVKCPNLLVGGGGFFFHGDDFLANTF